MIEDKSVRMRISIPGVLGRAADACERHEDTRHLACSLRMLLEHLRTLRGEPERIGDFFDLWIDYANPDGGSKL
jgi:hypothetical protein